MFMLDDKDYGNTAFLAKPVRGNIMHCLPALKPAELLVPAQ